MIKLKSSTLLLALVCILATLFTIIGHEYFKADVKEGELATYLISKEQFAKKYTFSHKELLVPDREIYSPTPKYSAILDLPIELIKASERYAKTCKDQDLRWANKVARQFAMSPSKLISWYQAKCTNNWSPFKSWLTRKPFLHPSGKSYGKLFLENSRLSTSQELENYLHVKERNKTTAFDTFFLSLSQDEQSDYIKAKSYIINKDLLVFSGTWNGQRRNVYIFPIHKINDELLRDYGLVLANVFETTYCHYHHNGLCINRAKSSRLTWLRPWNKIVLGYAITFLIGLIIISYREKKIIISNQNADQALLFQLVSHEIRTPLTSIKLGLDSIKKQFDSLDSNGQKSFMHMLDNFYDLEKVVLDSFKEIKGDNKLSIINVSALTDSLIYQKYQDHIDFAEPTNTYKIKMSPFWFEHCLGNLIKNAINHGAAPIEVNLMSSNGIVSVEVKDAGNPSLEDLENALTPHHKGKKSKGLGIGLSIVNRKINEVGGTLDIQANPTRFTMKFKLVEQE